jgi:hypothetical protein
MASVWLRIEQDVRLGGGDASHIKALSTNDEQAFESSSGLYSGGVTQLHGRQSSVRALVI